MKDKNLKVKILIGVPASGKSIWASEFALRNEKWIRVNRDDLRMMLKTQNFCDPKVESLINDIQDEIILNSLAKNLNVIVDNTNLKQSRIKQIVKLVEHKADIEFQVFDISLDKAIERDSKREKKVGENLIRDMFKTYKILVDSFDTSLIKKKTKIYKNPIKDKNKEDVILCDIDGTLAHMNGKRGPFDWQKVDRDDVDEIVADRLRKHKELGEKVIIVSGREDSCMDLTKEWLGFYNIPYDDIFMRKKDDFRKDSIIKKEIFENEINPKYNVLFVYDDRNQVVKTWRELGVKVFQVEEGNF
jgi:predicted kinase